MKPYRLPLYLSLALALLTGLTGCSQPGTGISEAMPPAKARTAAAPRAGVMQVSFIDIGQGDAELIRTPQGKSILIDAGDVDKGDEVVAYLKSQGVRHLDYVVATHPHADHIGGMNAVLKSVPVRQFLDSGFAYGSKTQEKMLLTIRSKAIPFKVAQQDDHIAVEPNVDLLVYSPKKPYLKNTDSDPNNNSVSCKITYGKTAFLFTGDMEEDGRARMYSAQPDLKANVLKVAHHGSHNGTDDAFLQRVKPSIAVISCGKGNSYKHPHKQALDALKRAKAKVYRTDLQGTVVVTSNGQTVQVGGTPVAAPAPVSSDPVYGHAKSHIYHAASCSRLPSAKNRVSFRSAAEAEAAGYRAHSCMK
ncbi:MAG: MBL fold metallo-hydrolase [Armatimonadetes bacterium]|nr:MBL fold metallo-hydrolase [Armatimonadota bacterium]